MKKFIILSYLFIAIVLSAKAQLKVDSLGHVLIGDYSTTSSRLFINNINALCSSDNTYYYNLYSSVKPVSSMGRFYGISSFVLANYVNSYNIGVYGQTGYGSKNLSLCGNLYSGSGAAVFGSTSPVGLYANISTQYAGYFYGNVYVTGTLTANNIVTSSDLRLKENICSLTEMSEESVLNNVMNMNVVHYNYKKQELKVDEELLEKDLPEGVSAQEALAEADAIETVKSKKLHFGLIAQELQTIYPNLVEEGEDGYLGINYVELVPILIRSIQELKQEVDELRGTGEAHKAKSNAPAAVTTTSSTNTSALYQNTPNPFKEQTIIRYRLADNAKNAAICIFDMQGKLLKKYPVSSGTDSITISGYELGEGMFLYTLMVNGQEIDTKRMILTK